jgi:hypothetical protein
VVGVVAAKDLSLALFEIAIDHRAFSGGGGSYEVGRSYLVSSNNASGGQPCLVSMDSGLEASVTNHSRWGIEASHCRQCLLKNKGGSGYAT